MDWTASGITNTFEFETLDSKLRHTGWLENVTGGSIEESYRGDYRVTASLDLDGEVPPLAGYVRIWNVATLGDEAVRTCLATLVPERPSMELLHGRWVGSVDLYSAMKNMDDTLRLKDGALSKGKALLAEWRKFVNDNGAVAGTTTGISSTAKSTKAIVWEFGSPILSDAQTLADALNGYMGVDPQGRVTLTPYIAPAKRPQSWRLDSSERSIILPGLEMEPAEAVNRIAARYESNGKAWYAHSDAKASDPRSAAAIGHVVTETIDVETVVGGQSGWLQTYADRQLASRLATKDSYEVVTLFDPSIRPGTAGTLEYSDSPSGEGVTKRVFCSQREIELSPAMTMTLTLEAL